MLPLAGEDPQKMAGLLKRLTSGALVHAQIWVMSPFTGLVEEKIEVQYNPDELSLNQQAAVDGVGNNVFFHRTQPDDLVVSLVFDTYEAQTDVRRSTDRILKLTQPWRSNHGGKVPRTVRFVWADRLFTGIVTNVAQKFTMFLASGIPVRADVTVTFKEVLTDDEEIKALGLDNCRQLLRVSASDRLGLIAYNALGDQKLWRLVTDANGIYDPIGFPGPQWLAQLIAVPDTHNETYESRRPADYV